MNTTPEIQTPLHRNQNSGEIVPAITQDRLIERLSYNPETGNFYWKPSGRLAGFQSCNGRYISVGVDGVTYRRSRLAWLYVYGHWPKGELDHINGNKIDDRIENLRDVSGLENSWNHERHRRGYLPGTCYLDAPNIVRRWWARIKIDGACRSLRYWHTQEEAHQAYVRELKRLGLPCPTLK